MEPIIIGIDHGNGNIKTAHTVFSCGYVKEGIEPDDFLSSDYIEYNGSFYTLVNKRDPYQIDKTTDDKAFILSLFAIAKELVERASENKPDFNYKKDFTGFIGKDIILAIGLPPAFFENQKEKFKNYFIEKARYGIRFSYNKKVFDFHIKDVFLYPQDIAAALVFKGDILGKYSTTYCIDIGEGTADMVGISGGSVNKDVLVSIEKGMKSFKVNAINAIAHDLTITIDEEILEDVLCDREVAFSDEWAEKIKAKVKDELIKYTNDLINELRTKVPDFRVVPVIFCGGGSVALQKYFDNSKQFGKTYYISNIHANAIGYEELTKMTINNG